MIAAWESVETPPSLTDGELHIWRIALPEAETATESYTGGLSAEERERASRFRAGRVRLQYVVARASLRKLLGSYLGVDPAAVAIELSRHGKPQTRGIFYNVAHSGDTVLIAVCREHSVGVDVEYFSRETDALAIAKTSFAEREYLELSAISDPNELHRAFFRCWTRKEAVVKADGRGLSLPLASFELPVVARAENLRVTLGESSAPGTAIYYVTDIPLGRETAAAYAVSSAVPTVLGLNFPGSMAARFE